MNICFDVDDFLIDREGKPIEVNVAILKTLAKRNKVYMWSGNGWKHAYEISKGLGVDSLVSGVLDKYSTFEPDLAFDNQEIDLGEMNIKI